MGLADGMWDLLVPCKRLSALPRHWNQFGVLLQAVQAMARMAAAQESKQENDNVQESLHHECDSSRGT